MEDPYWQSFMEQAVRLIYFLAESPDQLCSHLLQRCARLLLDQTTETGDIDKDGDQSQCGSQDSDDPSEGECVSLDLLGLGVCVRAMIGAVSVP